MPITKSTADIITSTARKALNTPEGLDTGVISAIDFAICDDVDPTKQIKFVASGVAANTAISITAPSVSGTLATGPVLQYDEPLTEATVVVDATTTHLILDPAGTIAELAVTFPAASDGKIICLSCTQIVTALALAGAGDDTIANQTTEFAAGGTVSYIARSGVWYKC
jgi:hypothetical protein